MENTLFDEWLETIEPSQDVLVIDSSRIIIRTSVETTITKEKSQKILHSVETAQRFVELLGLNKNSLVEIISTVVPQDVIDYLNSVVDLDVF